jgi:hypothetical protein
MKDEYSKQHMECQCVQINGNYSKIHALIGIVSMYLYWAGVHYWRIYPCCIEQDGESVAVLRASIVLGTKVRNDKVYKSHIVFMPTDSDDEVKTKIERECTNLFNRMCRDGYHPLALPIPWDKKDMADWSDLDDNALCS